MNYPAAELTGYQQLAAKKETQQAAGNLPQEIKYYFKYFSASGFLSSLGNRLMIEPLTNREIEVLRMLSKGSSNNDIAQRLLISTETVKKHLYTIYRKLDVKNRHQAVISSKSLGIL